MTTTDMLLIISMGGFSFFGLYYFYICIFAKKGRERDISLLISSIGIVFFLISSAFIIPEPIGISFKLGMSLMGIVFIFFLKKGLFGPVISSKIFLRPSNPFVIILFLALAAYGILSKSKFNVNSNEQIILTQFGQIVKGPILKPGVYYKVPSIQIVKRFSTLTQNFPKLEHECLLSNKKRLMIKVYGKWKIKNAKDYYKNVYDTQRANNLFMKANDTTLCNLFDNILLTEKDSLFENLALQKLNEFYKSMRNEFENYGIEFISIDVKPFGNIEL